MIHRSGLLNFIGNKFIFLVQEQQAKMFFLFMRHGCVNIVNQFGPVVQNGAVDRSCFIRWKLAASMVLRAMAVFPTNRN